MPDYGGYADLGKALFGGGANTQKAYNSALESGARVETLLAQAKIKRDEAMQREKFRDALTATGVAPEQADLLSTTFGAGYNPKQLSGYQLDQQEQGFRGDAASRATAGDFTGANAALMGVANGPQDLAKVQGGTLLGNVLREGGMSMGPTEVGAADIRATDALAGQREAGAGASRALEALRGRTDPNLRGTGAAAKPAAYTAPAGANLVSAFGGEGGTVPNDVARDFQVWRSAHPEFRNGEEALNAYISELGASGPAIIEPSMPGSMTRSPPRRLDRVFSGAPGDQTAQIEADLGRPLSQQERAQIATGTLNLQVPASSIASGVISGSGSTEQSAPPPQAIALLRASPALAAQFEAKYGVPAAQYLGADVPNPFDQFDVAAANPFDQFDGAAPARPMINGIPLDIAQDPDLQFNPEVPLTDPYYATPHPGVMPGAPVPQERGWLDRALGVLSNPVGSAGVELNRIMGKSYASQGMDRSAGEVVNDIALALRQGTRNVTSATVGLPVNALNAVNSVFNDSASSLASLFGQDAGPGVRMLHQPEAVLGIQEGLANTNADDEKEYASDRLKAQRSEFAGEGGLIDALGYLGRNPSALVDVGAQQVPQVLNVIPGAGTGLNIAAGALSAGAQNADQVAQQLRADGVPEDQIAERTAQTMAASTTLNALLPRLPGASTIERAIGGGAGDQASRSLMERVARGGLGEALQGAASEGGDQAISNVETGRPVTEGIGQQALLGALLEGPLGVVAGASERGQAPADFLSQSRAAAQAPPAPANAFDAFDAAPVPVTPQQPAPAPAPAADAELDDLMLRNVLPDETPTAAPAPPPAPVTEPVVAPVAGALAPEAVPARAAAAKAPPPAEVVEGRREWRKTERKDSRGRQMIEPVLDYSRDGLLEWLGANGGADFEEIRAQAGADPAALKDKTVMRPFGRVGWPALRKNGGLDLEALRERMQQDGWLPADDPSAPPVVGSNDALDLIMEAINGQTVRHPTAGHDERLERQREELREYEEERDAELAAELGFPDASTMYAEIERADETRDGRGFTMADYEDSLSIPELAERAADLGFGLSDAEIESIIQKAGGNPADQAAALWRAINREDGTNATERGTNGEVDPVGDAALRSEADGFGRVEEEQAGLFPAASTAEEVAAERRRRDAQRDGRTGAERSDMAAGDGELFAGDRPMQGKIEQPAFHGTPHTVNRFSLQKIGTGEGAQAYGWGMYFASRRAVAEQYAKNVKDMGAVASANARLSELAREMSKYEKPGQYRQYSDPRGDEAAREYDELLANRSEALQKPGNLYQVEVPEDSDLLDYDKPMSSNPPLVRERAGRVWEALPEWYRDDVLDRTGAEFEDLTGSEFYQVVGKFADEGGMPGEFDHPEATARHVDGKEAASHALYVAGIPGIRYLDGNSRSAGEGSHNYVIWDENAIQDVAKVGASRDMFVPTRGDRSAQDNDDGRREDNEGRPERAGDRESAARSENVRPDWTPGLGRRGKYAIESLVRRFGGSTVADTLAREFEEAQGAQLIGKRATTPEDLAAIAEVYRNPIFETLRYVFVDDGGKVVGETAVSSRMAGSAQAFPGDMKSGENLKWLARMMPEGATGLWLIHNHPSGNPSPSNADKTFTRQLDTALQLERVQGKSAPKLVGHVILNHKRFAHLSPDGGDGKVRDLPGADQVPDPLRAPAGLSLPQHMGKPDEVAVVGKQIYAMSPENSIAVLVGGARGEIITAMTFPEDVFATKRGFALLSTLAKRSGGLIITAVADASVIARNRNAISLANARGLLFDLMEVGTDGAVRSLAKAGRVNSQLLGSQTRSLRERDGVKLYDDASSVQAPKLRPIQASYTPEQQEFMRKAGVAPDTRGTLQKLRDWMGGKKPDIRSDELIQGAFDSYYGLKQAAATKGGIDIENDPYVAARMVNIASTMEAILRFGAPKMQRGVLRVDRSMPGLLDALKPVHDNLSPFFGWMVARRAKALKQQGRENLMSDADIAAGLSLAKGHEAEFKQAAGDYLRLKNAILDFAEQHGGTIDPVARAAWDHAEYIPFYREGDAGGPGTRKGIANQSSGIRALKGGEAALRDPLANIFQNFTRLMDSALKNRAMLLATDQLGPAFFKKLPMKMAPATIPLDQVKKHLLAQGVDQATIDAMPASAVKGIGRMLSIDAPTGDDVVRVMREGKAEYYEVLDPLLLRSLTAMHETADPVWIKPFVWTKNLLTAGATATPDFLIRNTLRDTGEATVTARENFVPIWDTGRGAIESLRESELAQDLMMAGSYFHGGLFHQGDLEATSRATRRALRKHGMTDSQIEKVVKGLINPKRWWDVYRSGLEASEMGSRISLARNRVAKTGSFLEGAFEAKDFLDFQLRGDAALMQFFTRVIPFLNARLQGNYRLARTATAKDRRKLVLARMAMLALASTALYAWNMLAYRDEYEELPEWERDAYWHFAPGTDRHIRIPKPFELGLLAGTAVERMTAALVYQFNDGEFGDRPEQTWKSLLRGIMDTTAINPIPQAVKPGAEVFFNYDTFAGRPVESEFEKRKAPSERKTPRTSATAVRASRTMEAILSEDMALSPKQIEHLWRGYTGGMGMYLLNTTDLATRSLEGAPERPDKALRDMPGLGAIYRGDGVSYSSRWSDEFYDLRDDAKKRSDQIKAAVEDGDEGRADRLESEWGWLVGKRQHSKRAKAGFMHAGVRDIDKASKELSGLRKKDEAVYANRVMTGSQKRAALEANALERTALARKMVRQIREAERTRTR